MPNLLDLTFNIPHASLDTAKNLKCLNRRKMDNNVVANNSLKKVT